MEISLDSYTYFTHKSAQAKVLKAKLTPCLFRFAKALYKDPRDQRYKESQNERHAIAKPPSLFPGQMPADQCASVLVLCCVVWFCGSIPKFADGT